MSQAVLVGLETTHGTIATQFLSVPAEFDAERKQANKVLVENRQGQDVNFSMVQGRAHQEFSLADSAIYHDTIGVWLASILGAPTKAVAAGETVVWDQTFKLANDPKSLSLKWAQPRTNTQAKQALYGVLDKLSIKFDAEGELTYSGSGFAMAESDIAAPAYAFTNTRPFASWAGAVTLGGSVITTLRKGQIDIVRNRKPYPTISNSQSPTKMSIGARTVAFDLTLEFADTTEYAKFVAGTASDLAISWVDAGVTLGVATNPQIDISLGDIRYEMGKIDTSPDLAEVNLKGWAVYDSVAASTIVVVVTSDVDYTALN